MANIAQFQLSSQSGDLSVENDDKDAGILVTMTKRSRLTCFIFCKSLPIAKSMNQYTLLSVGHHSNLTV